MPTKHSSLVIDEFVLKGLITEETILVEPKGLDLYSARSCIPLIMASIAIGWFRPGPTLDGTSFSMFHAKIQDGEYFAAITAELDSGGREALLDYLQKFELYDFNAYSNVAITTGVDRIGQCRQKTPLQSRTLS